MKKVYVVKRYGEPIFVTESEDDAVELAKAAGMMEASDKEQWVSVAIYIGGDDDDA